MFADESLDKTLAKAMEKNPEIITAKAKVTLAEAELNAIRLQVARQVVSQWNSLESQRVINKLVESSYNTGSGGTTVKDAQESKAKLQQLEAELQFLCGGAEIAGIKKDIVTNISSNTDVTQTAKPLQIPFGPVAEKYTKDFFAHETKMEFVDTPLSQAIDFIMNYHNLMFVIDKKVLADAGISSEMSITMDIKGVSLAAALQLFQDQYQGLQFVVRDYGILLTTIDQAKAQGYYPVLEYAKLVGKEKPAGPQTYIPRPPEPLRQPPRTEATKTEQDPFAQ